jgi:hypothetical protein
MRRYRFELRAAMLGVLLGHGCGPTRPSGPAEGGASNPNAMPSARDGGGMQIATGDMAPAVAAGVDAAAAGTAVNGADGAASGPASAEAGSNAIHDHQDLPCAVSEVLHARCHSCHGQPPLFGAPMSITTAADFQASALDMTRKVWQVARARIEAGTMPPASAPALSATEKSTLLAWLGNGAPPDPSARCGGHASADAGAPTPELPCSPTHTFRAHGVTANSPYPVPTTPQNHYKCFNIPSPFTKDEQAIAWAPIIDDARVVHHWILYQVSGTSDKCDQNKVFLMGWAPGNSGFMMPDKIGYELPDPGQRMLLEIHYNNPRMLTDAKDRSGVAVCTTREPRPTVAGTITFGRLDFVIPANTPEHRVTGRCPSLATLLLRESLHVLSSWPHMHQIGRKFSVEISRLGSKTRILQVDNFDFHNQIGYRHDNVVIRRGDEVITTCTFENRSNQPVKYGSRSEDEMCFNFAMVYPISAASGLDRVPLRLCDEDAL